MIDCKITFFIVSASQKLKILLLLSLMCTYAGANAVDVIEFDDELSRERYQILVEELRCPKCQNQNLADSNSQISIDLRREIVRLIEEGQTDDEIKHFMVSRYGDFVLYRPPVQANTLVLWWAPAIMIGFGIIVFLIIVAARGRQVEGSPSDDVESKR